MRFVPSKRIMKCEHSHRDSSSDTTSSALDTKTVAVFLELLHLVQDVSRAISGEGELCACRSIGTLFALDLVLELFHEAELTVRWRVSLILLDQLRPDLALQIRIQSKRPQPKRPTGSGIGSDSLEGTWYALLKLDQTDLRALLLLSDRSKAVWVCETAIDDRYGAITSKQAKDDLTASLIILLHVRKHQVVGFIRHWDAILGGLEQFRRAILFDVGRQGDGG